MDGLASDVSFCYNISARPPLPADGCHCQTAFRHASQSVIGWRWFFHASRHVIGWLHTCTCIVTSQSGRQPSKHHYSDVIMSTMASQMTGVLIVCSTVCSGTDQRKHQSSASLAFVRGIHRWPMNSPHKGSVTQKGLPFDDVIGMVFLSIFQGRFAMFMTENST